MSAEITLKPCPLCGADLIKSESFSSVRVAHYVHPPAEEGREECFLAGAVNLRSDNPDRVEAWNARAETREILEMTGEKSIAEVIGMANVGSSLMERIHILTKDPGPFHAWTPADDPAEIVFDLVNHYEDEATALKLNRDQYQQAYRHWSMIADQRLGASNRSLFRARQAEADAARYRYLRDRDMSKAGLFIGLVPENLILTGADADAEIDEAIKREAHHG